MASQRARANWRYRELLAILGIALFSIVLWRLPGVGWLLYPFQIFTTFVHELSHGLAAVITGGSFRRFVVNPDLSGTAWSAGGIRWIVVSAGYIGSAVWGAALSILSARRIPARGILQALGLLLSLMTLLFVRNLFGIGAGLLLGGVLWAAGRRLSGLWADGLVLLLAVQLILNALDSLLDLVLLSAGGPDTVTDARIMAAATGIPAIIWALLWNAVALVVLGVALRVAYRRPPEQLEAQRMPASTTAP